MKPIIQIFARHCRSLIRRPGGVILLLAAVALFAFPANGITPPPETAAPAGPDGFSQADTNHDGKLSRDEASDYLVIEIFISRDANHDGRMTLEEWVGGDPTRSADFKKRDANDDGIVTTTGSDRLWARARCRERNHAGSGHGSRRRAQSRRSEGLLREPRRPGELGPVSKGIECAAPKPGSAPVNP